MKQMKMMQKLQKGFTLIELVIVVMVLGILAVVVAKQFGSGVSDGARAQALYESANKLTQNWSLLAQSAGTSTTIVGSPIPIAAGTSGNVLDLLIQGGSATTMSATYLPAWATAGISSLSDIAQGTAGSYTIVGYGVTLGGGGTTPLTVAFAGVPDTLTLQLVQKYGSKIATLAASDTTNSVIQYSTATAGARTVTILKQP